MSFESGALVVLPGGASQTWPVRATQGNSVRKRDSKQLLSLLANKDLNVRNFFGHGHGIVRVDEIGPIATVGYMGMNESELKRKLKNRRYRFVFLNGCETASDLFSAFGAADFEVYSYDANPLDISAYSGNLRPAAFLGWKASPHYID